MVNDTEEKKEKQPEKEDDKKKPLKYPEPADNSMILKE